MEYGFILLCISMMFLLVMMYYSKDSNFIRGNKLYRIILLVGYIIQLVSCFIYMMLDCNIGYSSSGIGYIYYCVYALLLLVWFGVGSFYFLDIFIKSKYRDKNISNIIIRNFCIFLVIVELISFAMVIASNVGNSLLMFVWFYLFIELVILLLSCRVIKKNAYMDLLLVFGVELLMVFLQGRSLEIPFINIGIIFVSYYLYFKRENALVYDINNLVLEREYAKKKCIDKVDFLKVLSHEIRTPINTIDGFGDIISNNDNIDEIKNDINDIRLASRELIDVINGMIDLSIIESGNLEIIKENYNVYDMIDDISNIIKSKMRNSDVLFNVDVDNDIPEVLEGDSERISQVVLSLLTNSIKYTDNGNITLSISSIKSNNMCRLKFVVSDTGRGISNEDMLKIFEVNEESSGLGLVVAKYLIELMGGNIEVQSTLGKCSIFSITIDQKIVNVSSSDKVSRRRVLKPFDALNKKILLVDDNKLNLKVASRLLKPYNVEVVVASSGQECLDILDKDTDYDLILMDDLMPEMSGTECLDILKKIERVDGFYIPVVVLTANAVSGEREKYLNVGFDDYLSKPIDKYELDRVLKKFLKGRKR